MCTLVVTSQTPSDGVSVRVVCTVVLRHPIRRVAFFLFPIMLGESPAVSSGNAITIGWDPIAERSVEIEIDDYEHSRGERRTPEQIILPSILSPGVNITSFTS